MIFLASYLRDNRQSARDRWTARARVDDPADEAVRPDADRVGRGDGDAAVDARARHLADVLRRLPRAAVCRHRALLVPADRPGPVRPRRVVRRRACRATCTRACSPGNTPSTRRSTTAGSGSYQLAQSLFAQADGGLLGTGFDQSLLRLPHGGSSILPVPESDMIYAVITNELGLARRRRRCCSSTCCSSPAA